MCAVPLASPAMTDQNQTEHFSGLFIYGLDIMQCPVLNNFSEYHAINTSTGFGPLYVSKVGENKTFS